MSANMFQNINKKNTSARNKLIDLMEEDNQQSDTIETFLKLPLSDKQKLMVYKNYLAKKEEQLLEPDKEESETPDVSDDKPKIVEL